MITGRQILATCMHAFGILFLAACASAPGARVVAEVQTMKTEQSPDKLLDRGRAFAAVGDYTRAEQYLAAALNAGVQPRRALPTLLRVCIAERRFRAAIEYAEALLKKHPNDHRLRFVVASLYATIGESRLARKYLGIGLRERPDHAEVHYAIATLLRRDEGDIVDIDHHFREYLRLKPTGPHADEARGFLLRTVP